MQGRAMRHGTGSRATGPGMWRLFYVRLVFCQGDRGYAQLALTLNGEIEYGAWGGTGDDVDKLTYVGNSLVVDLADNVAQLDIGQGSRAHRVDIAYAYSFD